jgi:hypothetical protein
MIWGGRVGGNFVQFKTLLKGQGITPMLINIT